MAKQVFCCALLLISILTFTATAHSLEVVNELSTSEITVYAPPICRPCPCQGRRDCVCTLQCIENGKVIAPGSSATVAPDENYPLAYLTVEVGGVAYNVKAVDLERITVKAKLVVTSQAYEKGGFFAKLYRTSKQFELICLVPGDRYGS